MKVPGAISENPQDKTPPPGAGDTDPNETLPPKATAGQGDPGADPDEDDSDFSDPVKAKEHAKKLRAEAAKHRTEKKALGERLAAMEETQKKLKAALGLEDEEADPAELAQTLQSKNEALEIEIAMVRLERQHGITPEQEKYFRFLVSEAFDTLEEGEELPEEKLAEIAQSVKSTVGAKPAVNATGLHTGKKPSSKAADGDITVEKFVKMSRAEMSLLYSNNSELYSRLMSEAREKKLIK